MRTPHGKPIHPIPSDDILQEIHSIRKRASSPEELPRDLDQVSDRLHSYRNGDGHNLLFTGLVEARARLKKLGGWSANGASRPAA